MHRSTPAREPILIAHRGAHDNRRPQNSLVAIARAIDIGAPGVEFDVNSLEDGTLVIAHDHSVHYRGNETSLATLTAKDLDQEFASGELVRVEPALELLRETAALVCLDWKGAGEEGQIGILLESFGLVDKAIVSSTDPVAVRNLKQQHPEIAAGLSFHVGRQSDDGTTPISDVIVSEIVACRADAAMLHRRLAAPAVLAVLREQGIAIFLWTADDRHTFETLWSHSPDGVMSDAIDEHLSLARRRPAGGKGETYRGPVTPPQA